MSKESAKALKEREIQSAWESWEMLLYNRLVDFDHFLTSIQADLASAGLPYSKSGQFLVDKIVDMQEQIRENKQRKAV